MIAPARGARERRSRWAAAVATIVALGLIGVCWFKLAGAHDELERREARLGPTPVTITRAAEGPPGPAVVIAHGFAGSRQLMEPFAITLARRGYTAISFDFLGHGRNAAPLTGDVRHEDGATVALLAELGRVVDFARKTTAADGRVALLGHSMASDIIVRHAVVDPEVSATVAVSMFSREVTERAPANLLIIVGGLERALGEEALRMVALALPSLGVDGPAREGVVYGAFADGSARSAVFADGVEHVGVLYSRESLTEAAAWLDAVFGPPEAQAADGRPEVRGPAILGLILGLFLLAWPLSRLAPTASEAGRLGASLPLRAFAIVAIVPAVATPLLLWRAPTDFLPVPVADYLAAHFAVYGAVTALALWAVGAWPGTRPLRAALWGPLALGVLGAVAFGLGALGTAIDAYATSFVPTAARAPILLALFLGAAPYFLADEWAARGPNAPLAAYASTKLAFLASLAAAIALNLSDLFFLIIIAPVIAAFFLLFGLTSGWLYRATGHPWVGGLANAALFAWSIGVAFPLLAS